MALVGATFQDFTPLALGTAVALAGLSLWFLARYACGHRSKPTTPQTLPEVPGLPVIGNLLQLKEKKPHKTFTQWAKTYGPIYSIRTGANIIIVLNSSDVVKEAMVTRFSSISTRKLSSALKTLTFDKTMVAMSDYDDFHKMMKRLVLTNVLGPNAQKRHRIHRETLIENTSRQLQIHLKNYPLEAVNLNKIFDYELFGLAIKQVLGKDVASIRVGELGITMSREDIIKVLVTGPMEGAIEVDWRDFFPYLRWIPNKSFERKIQQMCIQREALMKALIQEQKKRIDLGEDIDCYLDFLLSEAKTLSEKQMAMLLWEVIIQATDTTMVTVEWAMFELAKNPKSQDRLYREIQSICGPEKITEDKLCHLPYLSTVFHETIRKYSPIPVIPLRYVHEDTELGGYHIPARSEIAINIYGCNMDNKVWENPEEWRPERFLDENNDTVDLFKTMSFGGGRRICAGALQAMVISCMAIGRFIQEFEWQLKDGEEENVDTQVLTTRKLHPMQAILKPRN
ncbi:hypothetical protein RJ640_020333 [Escallonia rubra]|uniref:ent-kaurene monooxygenase n=1 Tax=Escallonia rubra TaxID=112253 RepID=A0AA88U3V2_9ASTE|nr:hypothetical protein RJ640_020333 [Escallonia rubra]